jgi:hypothetical protein
MQSRLFAKKVIKMVGQASILEAFGGHLGAFWTSDDRSETFLEAVEILMQKRSTE